MTRSHLTLLLAALLALGCSESHTTNGEDGGGGISFDAMLPDGGGPPPDLCGNGRLDPGEECDHGGTPDEDCDEDCRRGPYCGNGIVEPPEVCDDGNNRSGDGCRADCMSDETCGNGIVDRHVGEVCDSTPGCADDCRSIEGCGNGILEPELGEVCDDGNTDRWDGCGPDCQPEIAMVVDSLSLAGRNMGCDLTGTGTPDNAFARALGPIGGFLGPLIDMQINSGDLILLMAFLGLDDLSGANADDLRVAWLNGVDPDGNPSNNFSGNAEFRVSPDTLAADGSPTTSIQSRIVSRALSGGPEDIPLPIGFLPVELRQGTIEGTTVAASGEFYRVNDGNLCGGVPISLLALIPAAGFIEVGPPCDGSSTPPGFPDLMVGGAELDVMGFPLRLTGTQPDLDLDGDGLEYFEVESDGPEGCQPVIVACIDGDGTRIEGRNCYSDPRIADGYSAAFQYSAIRAHLVGVDGADPGPDPDPDPEP